MPGVQKPHCRPCFSQKPCWIGCRSPFFASRSEEHTSELQSQSNLVCRLLLEKKKNYQSEVPVYEPEKSVTGTIEYEGPHPRRGYATCRSSFGLRALTPLWVLHWRVLCAGH